MATKLPTVASGVEKYDLGEGITGEGYLKYSVQYFPITETSSERIVTRHKTESYTPPGQREQSKHVIYKILSHSHPSYTGIIRWMHTAILDSPHLITENFTQMTQAVENCARSLRVLSEGGLSPTGERIVNGWVDNERMADEKLLELLHQDYVQIMLSKRV